METSCSRRREDSIVHRRILSASIYHVTARRSKSAFLRIRVGNIISRRGEGAQIQDDSPLALAYVLLALAKHEMCRIRGVPPIYHPPGRHFHFTPDNEGGGAPMPVVLFLNEG